MNALIRKEIRAIWPTWILALLLAVVPVWVVWPGAYWMLPQAPGMLVFAPFALGILLLSLAPFGQELNWGTFSILLAQPVCRRRLWLVKTVLLATALCTAFLALCLSNHLRVDSVLDTLKSTAWRNLLGRPGGDAQLLDHIGAMRREVLWDSLTVGGLTVLAGFAGGLWTTLLFRQTSPAFWLTLLIPLGLSWLTANLLSGLPEAAGRAGLFLVFGLYSAAGSLWAKRFFMQVQDTQWTGGVVSLQDWLGTQAAAASAGRGRNRRPLRALIRNEIASQQVNLLLGAGLLLSHLMVVALRKLGAGYLSSHRSLEMVLESFPVLWLAMPLLVGSVAVAEERKLGTFEGLCCLPTTRRMQFLVKWAIATLLGVVTGGVLPLLIQRLGGAVGLRPNVSVYIAGETFYLEPILVLGSIGITLLALHGSTLSRNTLQALGAGLVGTVLASLLIFGLTHLAEFDGVILWHGPLLGYIGGPIMLWTLLVLTYRNYKCLAPDLRNWWRNGAVLLLALIGSLGATTVIYHRAWEAWLPEEPPHTFGSAYSANPGQNRVITPKVQTSWSQMAVLLADGRLWLRSGRPQFRSALHGAFFMPIPIRRWHAGLLPGSNWRDVAVSGTGCFAIQKDGSLWDLSDCEPGKPSSPSSPRRMGESHDWTQISAGWGQCCGLKADGTLWEWGYKFQATGKSISRQPPTPVQVGTDTDWVAVAAGLEGTAAVKEDGSVWRWGVPSQSAPNGPRAAKDPRKPERWLVLPGSRPVCLAFSGQSIAAVGEDGDLWVGGYFLERLLGPEQAQEAKREMVRLGADSDWKQVQWLNWNRAVLIKRDGSLWRWDDPDRMLGHPHDWAAPPHLASDYPVWLATGADGNAFLALARDGLVCRWGDPRGDPFIMAAGPQPGHLLLPSRLRARTFVNLSQAP